MSHVLLVLRRFSPYLPLCSVFRCKVSSVSSLFPLRFLTSFRALLLFFSFLPPGQYSLTPIVICQLQYMSVPFLSQFDKFQSYVSVSIPFSALCHSFFKTIVVAYILYNKRSITATCFGKSCCHPQGIASKGWIHT